MEAAAALRQALADLAALGSPLILLRERGLDDETARSPGDYDFLLPHDRYEAVLEALHRSLLGTRVSTLVNAAKPEKRLAVLHDPVEAAAISCDLWREAIVLTGEGRERLLRHEALRPHCELRGPVLRMAPWLELAVYLTHLREKKKDLAASGVQERLRHYGVLDLRGAGCPEGAAEWLAGAPQALLDGRTGVREASDRAASLLELSGLLAAPQRGGEAWHWWRRRRSRSVARRLGVGPTVAVLGPDGSGKTTTLEALVARGLPSRRELRPIVFKRLYRRSIFRWLYKTVRKLRRLRRRDEQKEVVEVALAPFLFAGAWINYRLGQPFRGSGIVRLFDRFFPDLLVTNRKDGAMELELNRSYRWLAGHVPCADLAVLLAARPDVIARRKPEMTAGNASRYWELMAAHHTRQPPWSFLVLRTDIELERSIGILREAVDRA